jgi:hypothetical protein
VRIEIAADGVNGNRQEIERKILDRAEHWARLCVADRHAEITDGV